MERPQCGTIVHIGRRMNPFRRQGGLTMKLKDLTEGLEFRLLDAGGSPVDPQRQEEALLTEISDVVNDSRKACPGCLFFCIAGAKSDGHRFAPDVVSKGAAALLVERPLSLEGDVIQVLVPDTRHGMALVSSAFFGHPSRRLTMIGITGTKGKTTTTYLVRSILQKAGIDVGLIGTIEHTWHDVHVHANNTTPESLELQKILKDMADDGVQAVVMEVSSQALKLDRCAGIVYDIGVFTNLSPDHIGPDEHASFEEYLECKSRLFRQCRKAVMNGDDPHLEEVLKGHTCAVETYGLGSGNDLRANDLQLVRKPGELGISFDTEGTVCLHAEVPAPGRFSVYNALAAIAICRHFGVSEEKIKTALLSAHTKGRIELVKVSDDFTLMIDYAHNAVALESLLTTLREYQPHRLVTLFGCGGNRSRSRRFEMGEVSGRLSDLTIITSDNPRFEEPMDIIADIETGIRKTDGKYVKIPDRKDAIRYVIENGEPGDIIVLAGKGHEDYQEIKGVKYPMDERDIIAGILAQ